MCNLYTVTAPDQIAKYFRSEIGAIPYQRSVAPLSRAPIIIAQGDVRMAQ